MTTHAIQSLLSRHPEAVDEAKLLIELAGKVQEGGMTLEEAVRQLKLFDHEKDTDKTTEEADQGAENRPAA